MYKVLLFFCIVFTSFIKSDNKTIPYNLKQPEVKLTLPSILHEISGTTIIDSTTVGCIQDENGILFLYDLVHFRIKAQIKFALNGDYEGITKVNQAIYILRSDGVIFEIENYMHQKLTIKEHQTGIPAFNNEGICYDSLNNRLLIGAKGKINKDPQYKDQRFIYEFNLNTKKLNPKPVFQFNTMDVNLFAKLHGYIFNKHSTKNNENTESYIKFNTSEIAIHPITQQLYILSARDHCLLIYSSKGELEHIEQLNPIMFNKSEGMCFFKNGDMLISNEGQVYQPTLLKFNYKP